MECFTGKKEVTSKVQLNNKSVLAKIEISLEIKAVTLIGQKYKEKNTELHWRWIILSIIYDDKQAAHKQLQNILVHEET